MNANLRLLSIVVLICLVAMCPVRMLAQAPMINPGGIVNAADYQQTVAEGSIFSVFGTDLAQAVDFAAAMPLPVELRDVSVLVADGDDVHRAPLFYISPHQINAQMPYGFGGKSVRVKVKTPAGESLEQMLYVDFRAPRFFTKSQDGRGEGVLLHADFSVVSADNPATPGEILLAYLTGLGEVSPPIEAGAPAGDGGTAGLLRTIPQETPTHAFVNGKAAPVHWAGLAPHFAGLYQVNIQMPEDLPLGKVSAIIRCGEQWTQASVVMEVRQREQELANARIGPTGGVIGGDGVQVAVAAGAFESETQISIHRSEEVAPNANSAVYRISLPESFEAPLTLSLPLRESASEGRAFLAFRDNGDGLGRAIYFDAEVSGGSVVAQIPSLPALALTPQSLASQSLQRNATTTLQPRAAEVKRGYTIWAITGWYSSVSPSGKFEMLFPADDLMEGVGDELLNALDDAYSKLEAIGLRWKGRDSWPLRCVLEEFGEQGAQRVAEERPDKRGDNYAQMGFNKKFLGSRQNAELGRTTAGHELFHIMQRLYDPRNRFLKAVSSGPWLWMDEASSTWFERRMATRASYVSSNVRTDPENPTAGSDNYHFLKRGLDYVAGPASKIQDHGYGASMFLEYLSSAHGDGFVGEIIGKRAAPGAGLIGSFAYSPAEAIDVASNDVGTAWRRFCERYMEGSVYGNTPPFPGPGEIISGADIVRFEGQKANHTVSLRMDDLSAQAVVLDFRPDNLEWPDDAKLTLSLTQSDSGAMAIVYKRRGRIGGGEAWERVGFVYSEQPMEIPGVMDMIGSGYDLVIFIANGRAERPYSGAQTVEFTVNMQPDTPLSVFQKSWQSIFYNKQWTAKVNVTVSTTSSLFGLEESMIADRYLFVTAPILVADSVPPKTDTYTLKVSLEQVQLVKGEIPEDYSLVVTGQFDGGAIVEGTSFEKEFQVTRGSAKQIFHDFAVILYYKPNDGGEQFWKAGEVLFVFHLQPTSQSNFN